jgi:hypothetical protein
VALFCQGDEHHSFERLVRNILRERHQPRHSLPTNLALSIAYVAPLRRRHVEFDGVRETATAEIDASYRCAAPYPISGGRIEEWTNAFFPEFALSVSSRR